MNFNKVLRGMQHERIKYQDIKDFEDKGKLGINTLQDEEFERKIKEFQQKAQERSEKEIDE